MCMYVYAHVHAYVHVHVLCVGMYRRTDTWMEGWMDGWTDGWMDRVAHAVSSKWILQGLMISRASTKALIGFRKEKPYSLE